MDFSSSKKWAAGKNKQHSITKNTAKLDRATEKLHQVRVTLEVDKVIQRGLQDKGLTEKELPMEINVEAPSHGQTMRLDGPF